MEGRAAGVTLRSCTQLALTPSRAERSRASACCMLTKAALPGARDPAHVNYMGNSSMIPAANTVKLARHPNGEAALLLSGVAEEATGAKAMQSRREIKIATNGRQWGPVGQYLRSHWWQA